MGVPKFYRWISERYPKINQVITDSALLPEFDHLYLDMNGIIHGCTHPSHMDISDVLSERDMMFGIMHYLDRIVTQIVKPKVSVYMAIDGVAPRAKLNQQRSRRFRSAKDLADATKDLDLKVVSKNDDGNNNDSPANKSGVFDSNCITPGTEFMARVSATIKYFIRKKIKEDPLWRNLKVVFSGHEIPGEGEHKIMQHIREMRAQPGYQPNNRHCMYGQDADLIMLGLVSHEPHFTLLREIVDFGFSGGKDKNSLKTVMKFTKQSDFQLLHLSVLREYLQMEFAYGLEEGTYDLEKIIDDFVFMTFLVGNDFLPHMPSLDIGDGAFDLLFDTYKDQRPTWGNGQYLSEAGEISDPARLEAFIAVIGAAETQIFEDREEKEAQYIKKKRKWNKRDGKDEGPTDKEIAEVEASKQSDYLTMIENMMEKHSISDNSNFVDGWTPVTEPGQKDFKGRYYFEKLKMTPIDIKDHLDLRKAYIEGLMWCLAYYYRGCISWSWYYAYHYGPMLSDLTNLPKMFEEIRFDPGKPLKPFEQLMACLPPASSSLVPRQYRKLMTAPDSPIIYFYPETFEIDMNGKTNPWEGVNLLPFIDIDLLKKTITENCPDKALTAQEIQRNTLGKVFIYTFDLTATETIPSVNREIGLTDILKCHSRVNAIDPDDRTDISFKPELIPGTKIPYPGFPSLNVLPIKEMEIVKIGLNCFGSPSKYLNMTLTLHDMPQIPPAEQIADNILGKSLYINWPMMHEGRVVAVSDSTSEVRMIKKKKTVRKWTEAEVDRWETESEAMVQQYLSGASVPGSGGVNIGSIQIRLKLVALQGMKTSPSNGSTKKLFGKEEADVPLQLALWKAPAEDPRFIEKGPVTLKDRFPANTNVVLTKGKYRGCRGTILGAVDGDKVGVKVQVIPPEPPFGLAIARSVQESYVSAFDAAKVLKLLPTVFNKITGSLLVQPGNYDLGLNLKYSSRLCVVGYTRKRKDIPAKNDRQNGGGGQKKVWGAGDSLLVVGSKRAEKAEEERIQWEFTAKAIRLVAAYRQQFPQVFAALTKFPNEYKYDASKLFGSQGAEMLPKVREWLNNIETAKIPRTPTSTETMPIAAVHAVQRAADVRVSAMEKEGSVKESLIKVPSSALYSEGSTAATDVLLASDYNDNVAPELGDRIANLCANGIPFGARGTIVSVHDPSTGCVEVVMDEEFIGGSTLQGACANFRGKLAVWAHLLRISASDSKGVVDQMIPVGSGKIAIDKLIEENKDKTYKRQNSDPPHVTSSIDAQIDEQSRQSTPATPRQLTPSRTTASTGRAGSTGRQGRQGAWREALGPPEKGIGFKGAGRGKKTGIQIWRNIMASEGATELPNGTSKVSATQTQSLSTSAGLKALLGVENSDSTSVSSNAPVSNVSDNSANLKAMLGVGNSQPSIVPPSPAQPAIPSQPTGASAADKLLQLMMNKQPSAPQQVYPAQQASSFNFTYVKEGEVAPQQQPMPMPPPPPPPVPMPMMYPPVIAQPPYVSSGGYMQTTAPPPPPTVSQSDFPPLGSTPTSSSKQDEQIANEDEKKGTGPNIATNDKGAAPIVPASVVMSQTPTK